MRFVAFLRAINVGGRIVRMDRLRAAFEADGFENVATFIASGNVIFESRRSGAALEARIETMLRGAFGYDVTTMVRSLADVGSVVAHVQAQRLASDARDRLYVGFLKAAPSRDAAKAIASLSNDVDRLSVHVRELYWRSATSFSESTVTGAQLEKALKTPMTLRNITTVQKLAGKYGPASRP